MPNDSCCIISSLCRSGFGLLLLGKTPKSIWGNHGTRPAPSTPASNSRQQFDNCWQQQYDGKVTHNNSNSITTQLLSLFHDNKLLNYNHELWYTIHASRCPTWIQLHKSLAQNSRPVWNWNIAVISHHRRFNSDGSQVRVDCSHNEQSAENIKDLTKKLVSTVEWTTNVIDVNIFLKKIWLFRNH